MGVSCYTGVTLGYVIPGYLVNVKVEQPGCDHYPHPGNFCAVCGMPKTKTITKQLFDECSFVKPVQCHYTNSGNEPVYVVGFNASKLDPYCQDWTVHIKILDLDQLNEKKAIIDAQLINLGVDMSELESFGYKHWLYYG